MNRQTTKHRAMKITPEQKRALKLHKKTLQASIDYYKNRGYDTRKFDAEMVQVNKLLRKTK